MLKRLHKSFTLLLMIVVFAMFIFGYVKQRDYQRQIADLHNEIALGSETVELHKNAYEKKTAELEDLESLLKTFELDKKRDSTTIKKLRKLLKKKESELLTATRLAAKWKEAYEAEVDAEETTETDENGNERVRVSFDHDFGYLGVSGFTLTNPAYAKVKVQQNRPLLLTLAISQEKDKSWSTYVTSSEENVQVDVKLSGVNPLVFEKRWYEKFSVDMGMDFNSAGLYPFLGMSYPVGPVNLSAGLWGDTVNAGVGYYSSISYSWSPFARKN